MKANPMRYGIISALPQEQHPILKLLSPNQEVNSLCGRTFISSTLNQTPVVLTLSGIGKVAAATTTALLLNNYGVDHVILIGVAGSVSPEVQKGDVVLATSLIQYDFDCSPIFARYEIPGTQLSEFPTSPSTLSHLSWCFSKLREESPLETPKVHKGVIASGGQFLKSRTPQIQDALTHFPNTLAVEMEGAAVAQVCHDFNVPCSVIRFISGQADEKAHQDFPKYLESLQPQTQSLISTFFDHT